jgi:hypothetical protein
MKKSNSQKNQIKISVNNNNSATNSDNNKYININEKIKKLESENVFLKNKIKVLNEKEKSYISMVQNLKNLLNENEFKDNQNNEMIKQKCIKYRENSKSLRNEINLLYQELFHKNEIIVSYQNNIYALNEKLNQDKLQYFFKERDYEKRIKKEKRKLKEIKLVVNQITKEASKTIKNLNAQLEEISLKSAKSDNFQVLNTRPNLNSIQKNLDQLIYMMTQDYDNIDYNTIDNSIDNINKLKKEIYILKYENNKLKNELQKKNNGNMALMNDYNEKNDYNKKEAFNTNNDKDKENRNVKIHAYKNSQRNNFVKNLYKINKNKSCDMNKLKNINEYDLNLYKTNDN